MRERQGEGQQMWGEGKEKGEDLLEEAKDRFGGGGDERS